MENGFCAKCCFLFSVEENDIDGFSEIFTWTWLLITCGIHPTDAPTVVPSVLRFRERTVAGAGPHTAVTWCCTGAPWTPWRPAAINWIAKKIALCFACLCTAFLGSSLDWTRKSSRENARGIPTPAYQVLPSVSWRGVPPQQGYPAGGTPPQPGLMGGNWGGVTPRPRAGPGWGTPPPPQLDLDLAGVPPPP